MKFTSPVYSQTSGSIAGLTYSRNRGGLYTRARVIPSNPQSAAQQVARTATSVASTGWGALTSGQRDGWNLYAASVPLIDALGAQIQVSGINMFVRSNVPRIVASLDPILDPPDELNLGETPTLGNGAIDASDQQVSVDGLVGAIGTGNYLLASVTRPVPLSRTPAHEPTHFIGAQVFAAGSASVQADGFFPWAVGQRGRIWARVTRSDGRLSPWAFVDVDVQA